MDDGRYVIGNCTWYAWGRAAEILGYAPAIGSGMPYDMVSTAQANGYRTGPVPADGALAVGQTAGGSWHVAVVEDVSGNVPYVSQSAYTTSDNWPGPEGVVFDYIPLNYAFKGKVTYIYLMDNGMTFDEVARAEREARAAELCETLAEDGAMYRLYNPYSGEHFYTSSVNEVCMLVVEGWQYEGAGWVAPATSSTPVYRLYNPYAGDHHYTTSSFERDHLIDVGWNDEGIGWYSDDTRSVPVYRQYNPYAEVGTHNYTTSAYERDSLVGIGWRDEGVGWYALS
jgi:surface antigen